MKFNMATWKIILLSLHVHALSLSPCNENAISSNASRSIRVFFIIFVIGDASVYCFARTTYTKKKYIYICINRVYRECSKRRYINYYTNKCSSFSIARICEILQRAGPHLRVSLQSISGLSRTVPCDSRFEYFRTRIVRKYSSGARAPANFARKYHRTTYIE